MTDEPPHNDPTPEGPDAASDPAPERPEPEPAPDEPRRLTRSGSDAIIGGVASGLGRYFGVDPILFRIGFVVLTFVGAVGILAYLALLAFVPTDGEQRPGGGGKAVATIGAIVLGCVLVTFLSPPLFFFGPGLLVIGLIGLAGFLLWRALGGAADGDPARTIGRIALAGLIGVAVAGAALGVGLAAALGGGVVIASLAVVAGLALVATAFVGGVRWLVVPALALVLPLGVVAAAGIDLDGGVGDRDYRPASASQLRDKYELGIGSLRVDLRNVDLPPGQTDLDVNVGIGEAVVYVPSDACITADMQVGAGGTDVLDRDNDGVDVSFSEDADAPPGRPKLHVNGDVGLGVIEVVREGYLPDRYGSDHWFDERYRGGFDTGDGDGGTMCA
jgi:phage shock protein PspC (stress-responsive transcriptional regulator)